MTKIIKELKVSERGMLTLIFVVIFSLLIFDVWEDLQSGASLFHVGFEAVILLLALSGIIIQWSVYFAQKQSISQLNKNLDLVREDLDHYKQESAKFINGLAETIDDQLDRWKLSPAEKEVSLLVLKGLHNKEIAEVRETSESTIRQQLTSIYQKSGLSSRLEIASFFLEDLML